MAYVYNNDSIFRWSIWNVLSLSKFLETVPNPRTTSDVTVTFVFLSFICSLARSLYLPIFSLSFIFTDGTAKFTRRQFLLFFLINTVWSSGHD